MIEITGLNHKQFILNAEHIEKIEAVPETLIILTNGKRYLVKEGLDEVIQKVIEYKKRIFTMNITQEAAKK